MDLDEGLIAFRSIWILPADIRDNIRRVGDIFRSNNKEIKKLINFKKYFKFI